MLITLKIKQRRTDSMSDGGKKEERKKFLNSMRWEKVKRDSRVSCIEKLSGNETYLVKSKYRTSACEESGKISSFSSG